VLFLVDFLLSFDSVQLKQGVIDVPAREMDIDADHLLSCVQPNISFVCAAVR